MSMNDINRLSHTSWNCKYHSRCRLHPWSERRFQKAAVEIVENRAMSEALSEDGYSEHR